MKPTTEQVQTVLNFASAKATAAEIEAWRVELKGAVAGLEHDKDALKESEPYKRVEASKERVKEIQNRIADATVGLTQGLAGVGT